MAGSGWWEHSAIGPNGQQHVLGVASLPVYNQITLHLLRRAYGAYDQVVWCVSNCFFGNKDIERLRSLGGKTSPEELFLWSDFYAGNVDRNLITPENTDLLVRHSARCIDFILSEMPRTKLLFWCLAKRTFNKQGRSKQIPVHGQYEAFIHRYQEHSLDVLKYHGKDTFDQVCCQDRSGHPTFSGYATISQLLEDACADWIWILIQITCSKRQTCLLLQSCSCWRSVGFVSQHPGYPSRHSKKMLSSVPRSLDDKDFLPGELGQWWSEGVTGPRMDSELCRQRGDTNVRTIIVIAGQLVCLKAKITQTLSRQKRIGQGTDRRVQESVCKVLVTAFAAFIFLFLERAWTKWVRLVRMGSCFAFSWKKTIHS